MRIMTCAALAIVHRLMFYLGFGQKIIVAGEANRLHRTLHFLRELRLVALRAFVVEIGKVDGFFNNQWRGRSSGCKHRVGRTGFSFNDCVCSLRAGHGHTVEKYRKPFLFRRHTAPGEDDPKEKQRKGYPPKAPVLGFEWVHGFFFTARCWQAKDRLFSAQSLTIFFRKQICSPFDCPPGSSK